MQNIRPTRAPFISRSARRTFALCVESLERRQMFHGVSINQIAPGMRALFDDDGHITRTNYNLLNARQKATIGLHQIEDDRTQAEQLSFLKETPTVTSVSPNDVTYALPDLVPLVGTSSGYLQPYLDQTEQPGRNLLRFSTAVGNQGDGPATFYSGTTPDFVSPDARQIVHQKIYSTSGNAFTQTGDRDAGHFVYHPTHGHFHFEDYARYSLLTSVGGQPGTQVYRADGTPAVGDKVGFCLINIRSSFTLPGTSISSTTLANYSKTGQPSTGCGFLQGISVGRADVYDSVYDGQWIDVTGVPNGNYFLEVTLDASNAMLETNEVNNTVRVAVTISATAPTGGIPLDRFETPVPNNDFAHASDLGELGIQTQSGLSMHADSDADYFKFTASSSGNYNVELAVADRIVDLYVYDNAHTELGHDYNPATGTTGSPITKRVTTSFIKGQTYYVRAEGFSGSGSGGDTGGLSMNYSLKVLINPTARTLAPLATAGEDGLAEGSFLVARNGPSSGALNVNFTVGGTATRGVDYDLMYNGSVFSANSIVIGVESLSETIRVVPKADSLVEALETVTLLLGTSSAYVVDAAAGLATVALADTKPRSTNALFNAETNTVAFDFSLDVSASVSASDLVLTDFATGLPTSVAARSVTWDSSLNRATFTLNGPLPRGEFAATLPAASITHALGAALSADATARIAFNPGDVNLDAGVGFADLLLISQHFGLAGTHGEGDLNYDGVIDFSDLLLLSQNFDGPAGTIKRS